MTDYIEEQTSELETLRCIYSEEELTEVSESPPCFQIQVQSSDDEVSLSVDLQFTYTPTYPDAVPEVGVVSYDGLSDQQAEDLEAHINSLATENLGMVMIFTLVSGTQDRLADILDSFKKEREDKAKEREEELKRIEDAKFFGTPVTRENFLEWKRRFEDECRQSKTSSAAEQSLGLTGRQMFEKDASLALSDARFLTEASEQDEPEETVEVDESLFQDLDDLQI